MRQCAKRNATRVRIGRGVQRDLGWWQRALAVPNDGVAFFPLNHFPPSGSVDLLEFAYDASGIEGLGAAMLREAGNGEMVCYFIEHAWTDSEKRYHINVKEGLAGYAALASFYRSRRIATRWHTATTRPRRRLRRQTSRVVRCNR